MHTPALPTLYFSNDDQDSTTVTAEEQSPNSLNTMPPELLHSCLTKYADWGDLAKLACVQSKWKNIVEDAAEFGGRDAMFELSMCLLHGDDKHDGSDESSESSAEEEDKNDRGLQKNEALAVKYLTRMAGVEIDETQLHAEQAASKEEDGILPMNWQSSSNDNTTTTTTADEPALLQLATCHLNGTGLPFSKPNPTHALHYLQAAYHLTNSVQSAHKLALIYEYPQQSHNLIPVDVYAAFEWFKAAAENGHVPSMAELALCYELGCGITLNDEEALEWYTKAANAGHASSHYSVGEHFEEARGVRMDHEEACLWYARAARMGEEDGVGGLRRLEDVARRVVPELEGILNA